MALTLDTKISLLNGKEIFLSDLLNIDFEKDLHWIYSCNEKHDVIPILIKSIDINNQNKQLYQITLDNNESIKCTEDQLFMKRDGSTIQAKDLIPNESMMPLYRKLSTTGQMKNYEMILNPANKKWMLTHRKIMGMIDSKYKVNGRGLVVHHVDFNKRNNNPNNLRIMTWDDHTQLHMDESVQILEYAKSEQGRNKSRELMTKLWSDPEWREERLRKNKENLKQANDKLKEEGRLGFQRWKDADKFKSLMKENSDKLKGKSRVTPEGSKKSANTRKKMFEENEEYRNKRISSAQKNLKSYNEKLKSGEVELTEKQIAARRINAVNNSKKFHEANRIKKIEMENIQQYSLFPDEPNNHKILSISPIPLEPTYNISLNQPYPFALTAGIFVMLDISNCS